MFSLSCPTKQNDKIGVHSQILRHKSSSEGQILSRQASELLGKCLFEGQMLLPDA